MKIFPLILSLVAVLWLAEAAQAGKLVFKYRAPDGTVYNIANKDDLRRVTTQKIGNTVRFLDADAYVIMERYLDDVKTIKDRAGDMSFDTEVIVSSDLNQTYPNGKPKTGSWSSGDGKTIQIQTRDRKRMVSTLAHEVAHSYMRDKCGKNPTDGMSKEAKYGQDGKHYLDEITNERTALSEGYAEYHGDRGGGGQERVGCAGQGGLKDLCAEGAYDPVTKISDYPETDWKDINDPEKMWASEGVNSTMMRDFALYIPDGAAKIEALMCTSNTLKQVIAAWAKKYPKDADALAKIIDANTNYTMNKVKLGELLDGKAGAYLDKRAEYETKYKGKDPCDSLKKIFKDDKAKPPVGVGLPPTGGPTGEGKPTGGKGGWPGMKKF